MNINAAAANCTVIKNRVLVDAIDGGVKVAAKAAVPVCTSDRFASDRPRVAPCPAVNRVCHASTDKYTEFLALLSFGGADVTGF